MTNVLGELLGENRIAVMNQETIGLVCRNGFA